MIGIGICAQLACMLEATARKAGNVHPKADFDDCTYVDFVLSAGAVGPVLDDIAQIGVGAAILEGVRRTRGVTSCNTNLGILLLLAPLAAAAVTEGDRLSDALAGVLDALTLDDACAVYAAIRLARPGGLGQAVEHDVSGPPGGSLREVMAAAAGRDLIARQYANEFTDIFNDAVPALRAALQEGLGVEQAIVRTHLRMMARHPDSLIARKRGRAEAEESARRAAEVLALGWPRGDAAIAAFDELDGWLRSDGNARNPGATADLVTAGLFVALRLGIMELPLRWRSKDLPGVAL